MSAGPPGGSCVDILAGRLLAAPDEPAAPLQQLAQLPFPLGAVARGWFWAGSMAYTAGREGGTVGHGARQVAGVCRPAKEVA
ncbi:hypothetical protein A6P39_45505 [Streptomyces sp. FXJ1.172]|uniref:hypothetical protein n=1 Tax=Streptomyces sp. FXJ1.172 TaxID=710705 RepID=UPI0007CF1708